VRTQIPDFTGARRRKKTGKIWQNHGQQNDWGKTEMLKNGEALE
jgi:hypothetical protein